MNRALCYSKRSKGSPSNSESNPRPFESPRRLVSPRDVSAPSTLPHVSLSVPVEGTSLQPSQDSTGMPLSSGPGCLLSLLSQILFPWISLGLVPHPIQSLLTYHFTEEAVPGLPKRGLPSPTLSSFPHCNSLTGKQAPSLGERGGVCGLPLPPRT